MIKTLLERKRDGRRYRVLLASTVEDLRDLESFPGGMVALLVAPNWESHRSEWSDAAYDLLHKGLCYCCTWADGCSEGLHDVMDRAIVDGGFEETGSVIMTTWHDKDGLAEAAWFFVHATEPSESYEATCRDWLAIAVGDSLLGQLLMRDVKTQLD